MKAVLPALLFLLAGGCGSVSEPAAPPSPTFSKDVAPIVFAQCAPCHRTGQAAPFTLLSFADAQPRADDMAHAVTSRKMPPWLPAPGEPAFAGERRLREDQIATIERWAASGAAEGDPRDLPRLPVWTEGWELGTPDAVARASRPFTPASGQHDVYRNLVLPVSTATPRFVRAVEFQPGDAPVHHAVIRLDRTSGSRRRDGVDGQPGFEGMGGPGAQDPDGQFLGWAPGRGPIVAPASMPWRLEPGTDLVVELHLRPGSTPKPVLPTVALFFTDQPPAAVPAMLKMGSQAIDIPAGERDYAITDTFLLPVDADLLSVYPHAHFLGRQMDVRAQLPDGTTRRLLHIPRWSFHWQQDYRYVTPISLPRGTTVTMRFTYDNSTGNPENPHQPPVRVMAGQRSTDEMGNLLLQFVARSAEDRAGLLTSFARHEAVANVLGAEMLVRRAPDDAQHQRLLGSSYADVGRNAEAIVHLQQALRLDPRLAEAHNDLGGVLLAEGRPPDALASFQQALRLAPNDEHLHFNVARVLQAVGRPADAIREFERALELNPEFAEAHDGLGVVLFAERRLAEAIAHFRRAVALRPESPDIQNDLGGALAQAGRYDEALRHVRRALELRPRFPAAQENLERLLKIRR